MKQVEVVFCGNSLYLCGLAASMQQKRQFRICLMEREPLNAIPELKMLCPDVLIMEDVNGNAGMVGTLCKENGPIIIMVHPQTDLLEVVSGNRHYTASIDSLVRVITDVAAEN